MRRSSQIPTRRVLDELARPAGVRTRTVSDAGTRIFAAIRRIPRGRVATYGQIAAIAGLPRRARLVGHALRTLSAGHDLPWHRVLGAGGMISLMRLDVGSGLEQRRRLQSEGVRFGARGRVDMDEFGWKPRSRR
jgi:methylated-DNA-protein-cysteine methyltransferase related protein